jgi:hypothetical protein
MNYINDFDFVQIPFAYKAGELANVKPLSTTTTFERSGTALEFDSNGFLVDTPSNIPRITYPYHYNLTNYNTQTLIQGLTYSEELDNEVWITDQVTISDLGTVGSISRDNIKTYSLQSDSTNHSFEKSFTLGYEGVFEYTLSFYAGYDSVDYMYLAILNESTIVSEVIYDLQGGLIVNDTRIEAGKEARIEASQNGGYRCSLTLSQGDSFIIRALDGFDIGDPYPSTPGGTIKVSAFQLNSGSAEFKYTKATEHILSTESRYHITPVQSSKPRLLLEGPITYSANLGSIIETKQGLTTGATTTAVYGSETALKYVCESDSSDEIRYLSLGEYAVTEDDELEIQTIIKPSTIQRFRLAFLDTSSTSERFVSSPAFGNNSWVDFNLVNYIMDFGNSNLKARMHQLPYGFWRLIIRGKAIASSDLSSNEVVLIPMQDSSGYSYGDSGNEFYHYKSNVTKNQVEFGSFNFSNKAADKLSYAGLNHSKNSTVYLLARYPNGTATNAIVFKDRSNNNLIGINITSTGYQLRDLTDSNKLIGSITTQGVDRIAFSIQGKKVVASANGQQVADFTSISEMRIDKYETNLDKAQLQIRHLLIDREAKPINYLNNLTN